MKSWTKTTRYHWLSSMIKPILIVDTKSPKPITLKVKEFMRDQSSAHLVKQELLLNIRKKKKAFIKNKFVPKK